MNTELAKPIMRILLRYISGALVSLGVVSDEIGLSIINDADLQTILMVLIGSGIAVLTEWAYGKARKSGGST